MHKSDIDEIVDYSYKIRSMIINNQEIMALVSDDVNYDPDGDMAETFESHIHDHYYNDETGLSAGAYVLIDTDIMELTSPTMKNIYVYVAVVCTKGFMDIDPKRFKGVKGNRRDNIARLINNMIDNSLEFGIGDMQLINARLGSVPTGYTSRILTYEVPNYANFDHSV